MKIFKDGAVYVQKNDIINLNQFDLVIPASIYLSLFGNEVTIIDDSNRFEFVRYDKDYEIEFFKNIDWIIDYNEVKDLDENKILELAQNITDKQKSVSEKYNSMSEEEQNENEHLLLEYQNFYFKICSLYDVVLFMKGRIKMTLPEGVEYPKDYVEEESSQSKEKKNILSIFKRNKKS